MSDAELYFKPWAYFWVVQFLGVLLLFTGLGYKISFYFKARRRSLYNEPDFLIMLKTFFREVLFQKQLAEKSAARWLAHMLIFYGFIGLLMLSAIAVVLEMVIPESSRVSLYMLEGAGHNYYKAAGDLFGLAILAGLAMAIIRRYIKKDSQLYTDADDTVTLAALFLLVASGFLLEAARISMTMPGTEVTYSFIGYRLAALFSGDANVGGLATGLWVFHATLNAILLAYIPHSKFMHIINGPVEIVLNASEERMRGDLYI
ncbi:respiratory nitrate reductase subunit gamma [Phosphitispora fastidiosa]|uniref:respiratory nitrate reductase subunit gamma n=1 Tax=Phosphitispora fastidiosa TaxID=2837202 RepID=UPI001E377BD4|nr:respiratory nitrate reductase subunit gamma [Phosphitispora fastidiosa]MBU7007992.1 nitrate reductase gamma subunit [Phosphitispora fastidiosa]